MCRVFEPNCDLISVIGRVIGRGLVVGLQWSKPLARGAVLAFARGALCDATVRSTAFITLPRQGYSTPILPYSAQLSGVYALLNKKSLRSNMLQHTRTDAYGFTRPVLSRTARYTQCGSSLSRAHTTLTCDVSLTGYTAVPWMIYGWPFNLPPTA